MKLHAFRGTKNHVLSFTRGWDSNIGCAVNLWDGFS